jgi:hypothetical protein
MSFPRRTQLVRVAVVGLAVAAVGAPTSFAQQDPYSGEGYGGSMDGGSSLIHPPEHPSLATAWRDVIVRADSEPLEPRLEAAINRAKSKGKARPKPAPHSRAIVLPSDALIDDCTNVRAWGPGVQVC